MVSVRITMRNVTGVTLITGFVLLTGCGSASGTPGDSHSRPPATAGGSAPGSSAGSAPAGQDGHRLVLRGWISGGIAGRGGAGTLPEFSLYDDGSAIAPQGGLSGPVRPTEYRLTPTALQGLLSEAHAAGLARSRTVDRPGVADATYLTLMFRAGGRIATTRIIEVGTENDPAERFWRQQLHAQGTGNGIEFPAADLARDPAPYRPARLAVLASDIGQDTGESAKDWPLAPLNRGERVGGRSCTVLTGVELAKATQVLAADPRARWRSGGQTYLVSSRPLLPDEAGCRSLNSR
jgi:hypothetical protein